MCGIAGYTGQRVTGLLDKMAGELAHRGPDACSTFDTVQVHLVHTRLKVIDLESGAQPMTTADGALTVIFNGEIYNHKELRQELESCGHRFQTDHSDTEVLLHGYREWGRKITDRLNGMWAFCIFDTPGNTLFISRDRFGQKPLYYTQTPAGLIFASELRAIEKHPDALRNISKLSLQKFFAYGFIPHPHTIYTDVKKLPGGHNLLFNLSSMNLHIQQYWKYSIEPDYSLLQKKEASIADELREHLSAAVRRRLESDVALGVLLSGGIDSSAVAALASKYSSGISTFSIGFNEASYDESRYSSQVAELIASRHNLDILTIDDTRNYLTDILSRLDEPQGDDSLLPTYLVCKSARKHVIVALGGDGGDELFSGYEPYRFWRWARRYNLYLPKIIHKGVEQLIGHLPASEGYMSLSLKLKRFFHASGLKMPVWIPALMAPLQLADIRDLFEENIPLDELYSEAIESWNGCSSKWPGDRITQYYIDYYLQDEILAKTDRASMLNSLELRSPFLDIALADFARKLPHQLKIKGGTTKYLLKKSLEPILPKNILYRSKQGFSPPAGKWFADGSLKLCGTAERLTNSACTAKLLQEHREMKNDHRRFLWNQLTLEYFLENHSK